MSRDYISVESLRSGQHVISARADVDLRRSLVFVRRSFDRLALCSVEIEGDEVRRLLGVTNMTPTGLVNLREALDALLKVQQ